MQLFIMVNGAQEGPFSVDQVKGYLAMGQFRHNDLAWHEGLPDWKPLEQFAEFAPRAHRTPNYGKMPVRKQVAKKKTKKGSGVFASAFMVLVILGAAGCGGYYYWHKQQLKKTQEAAAQAAVAEAADAAAKAKGPETLEALNKWYEQPPAGQNAADFMQKGFDALQITDADAKSYSLPLIGRAQAPAFGSPMFGTMKTTVQEFLDRNQPALDLFLQGANCSGSRYPVDLTQGAAVSLPHLTHIKEVARLGELDALGQADAGNGSSAGQGVLVALASARSLDSEPLLISQLVRVASEGSAVDALEQVVNRVTLPADTMEKLKSAFASAADYEASGTGFNRALVGERVMGSSFFDHPPEKQPGAGSQMANPGASASVGGRPMASAAPEGNLKDQKQFFTDSIDQLIEARKASFPDRLKADHSIADTVAQANSRQFSLVAMMMPTLGRAAGPEAVALARLRLAETAIALEQFRAANANHFPDSLNQLAPKFISAVPVDPFDGQPLRYRKVGEGYVLYSVGPDLKDEGGSRRVGSDDVVFTVARPPKAT